MAKRLHLLIVEDSGDDALLVVRELKRDFDEVIWQRVDTAQEMQSALDEKEWQLVIADYMMPEFDGLSALEILKGRNLDMPFILISGAIGEETAVAAMRAGAHDYITKSNLSRLLPAVKRELREAEMRKNHRQAIESLRLSEEKYRLLVENQTDLMIKLNKQGEFIFVSPSYCDFFGKREQQVIGKSFLSQIPQADRSSVAQILGALQSPPFMTSFEQKYLLEGGLCWIAWSMKTIVSKGEEKGDIVGVGRDITERKIAQKEKEKLQAHLYSMQKMEAIGTFADVICHDFNNLLTGIRFFEELALLRLDKNNPLYSNWHLIQKNASRVTDMTQQLSAFTRKQRLDFSALNLNKIITSMLLILNHLTAEDVKIISRLATNLEKIKADAGSIEQVILNLAVNAKDAMPNGGQLTIATANVTITKKDKSRMPEAKAGEHVCLTFADTGIGMDEETKERIFEPFFTTKELEKGTGLGLSASYGIIKQHKGWIHVDSKLNHGTTFKIFFPILKSKERAKKTVSIQTLQGSGEKILLVEDEKGVGAFAAIALSASGYNVFKAADCQKAMKVFQREKGSIDLVFSDVVLPDKSGIELVQEIKRINPKIGVLLTSGYLDKRSQRELIATSGYAFLQKPYDLAQLLKVVKKNLGKAIKS